VTMSETKKNCFYADIWSPARSSAPHHQKTKRFSLHEEKNCSKIRKRGGRNPSSELGEGSHITFLDFLAGGTNQRRPGSHRAQRKKKRKDPGTLPERSTKSESLDQIGNKGGNDPHLGTEGPGKKGAMAAFATARRAGHSCEGMEL